MKSRLKLSILVPVLNEGTYLRILLPLLQAFRNKSYEVLIVYDIPNDNSIPIVESMQKIYTGLRLIHNRLGKGVINAIKAGVQEARGEYVLLIAADDIGPVLIIDDMVSLMDRGCDLVNGTRYAYGGRNLGGGLISKLLSKIANRLFYVLSGSMLTDPTLGVKMFRRLKFKEIKLESAPVGWAVSFELAIKAQINRWKVGEVPLISLNRIFGGKSSFKFGPWIAEYTKWFLWGISRIPRRPNSRHAVKIPSIFQKS